MLFVGHQKNFSRLNQESEKGQLPPAYLFYGLQGIGKRRVARGLVASIFCQGLPDDGQTGFLEESSGSAEKPCGKCDACLKVVQDQHPDLFFIEPIDGKKIKIDTIRDLQKKLKYSPLEAPCKIIIINDAHLMTIQAANSLLKILEEPPEATHFILIASNLFSIITTIRSRCRKMYFTSPSIDDSLQVLKSHSDFPSERLSELLTVCEGSPGMVLGCLDESYEEALKDFDSVFDNRYSFSQSSAVAQKWADKGLNWGLFMEMLKKKYFQKEKQTGTFSNLEKMDYLHKAQRDLLGTVNKTLVIENLFREMKNNV